MGLCYTILFPRLYNFKLYNHIYPVRHLMMGLILIPVSWHSLSLLNLSWLKATVSALRQKTQSDSCILAFIKIKLYDPISAVRYLMVTFIRFIKFKLHHPIPLSLEFNKFKLHNPIPLSRHSLGLLNLINPMNAGI